jgi:hypothetical protein
MNGLARIFAGLLLWTGFMTPPAHLAAQAPLFEVDGADPKLFQVNDDGGLLMGGRFGTGVIPASGPGGRLMWYPRTASVRAGLVGGSQWDDAQIGRASAAFGENTTASGAHAIASGLETIAGGSVSAAFGSQTQATGSHSFAAGVRSRATGERTVALGEATTASGLVATSLGYATVSSGVASTAMGHTTTASGEAATAMGAGTISSAGFSTAMGYQTRATANYSTSMGFQTQATGISSTAMGAASIAAGLGSVAMGTRAVAQGGGSFAFADRSSTDSYTAGENQFVVRAHGGIGFNSGSGIGCDLPAGVGAWACTSSRLAKEGFERVDGETVLAKLARIPIQRWSYLGTPAAHVGPTAEDFYGAFGLGQGPTTITTVDADGIALLGVQTLERRTAELRAENAQLLRRVEALERLLATWVSLPPSSSGETTP